MLAKEQFERLVEPEPTSGCWLWLGNRERGYGRVDIDGKRVGRASRLAYELYVGAVPASACVLHRCDNPLCVNPVHLLLGTRADNVKDMIQKGRWRIGRRLRRAGLSLSPIEARAFAKRLAGRGNA